MESDTANSQGYLELVFRVTLPMHRNSVATGASSVSELDQVGVPFRRRKQCCVPHCEQCACLESRSKRQDDSKYSAARFLVLGTDPPPIRQFPRPHTRSPKQVILFGLTFGNASFTPYFFS